MLAAVLDLIHNRYGMIIRHDGIKIALDPRKSMDADLTFISHAHADHMHQPSKDSKILASKETIVLASKRGYKIDDYHEDHPNLKLINSGHVLGSRSLLIDDSILYTSDICIRDRAFLRGARLPRCDTLIIESTYGRKGIRFPSIDDICNKANNIVARLYSNGIPVILLGYPLGKAQILTSLFKHWEPMYLHDSIYNMNEAYKELGIDLVDALPYSIAEEEGLLKRKPWVMIAPMQSVRSKLIKELKSRYSAITIAFTGWAIASRYSRYDYSLPLSDHCDFYELVKVVKECKPRKIYTFHGYAIEFAEYLNNLGYDAEPLVKHNTKLTDFTL